MLPPVLPQMQERRYKNMVRSHRSTRIELARKVRGRRRLLGARHAAPPSWLWLAGAS